MYSVEWPWVLIFLGLPFLVYVFVPKSKQEDAALRVPFFHRVDTIIQEQSGFSNKTSWPTLLLLSIIWGLLVVAAAKPTWVGDPISLPTSGRDLLVAVDISGSMEQDDMVFEGDRFSRIRVVKHVVGDFLERRESDRLGLILFGTQAYLQSPLTFDRKTVNRLLQEAQLGFAGKQTAIGDAIGLAIKRLKDRPESQRVVILLTDGANTAGEVDPRQAADLAKQADVKIYTIGVGADEMIEQFGFFRQRINPSRDLDEASLTYIAETTGGRYFRAKNPEELAQIYALLDELEPVEQEDEVFRPTRNLFYWPLGIALIIALVFSGYSIVSPNLLKREVN